MPYCKSCCKRVRPFGPNRSGSVIDGLFKRSQKAPSRWLNRFADISVGSVRPGRGVLGLTCLNNSKAIHLGSEHRTGLAG